MGVPSLRMPFSPQMCAITFSRTLLETRLLEEAGYGSLTFCLSVLQGARHFLGTWGSKGIRVPCPSCQRNIPFPSAGSRLHVTVLVESISAPGVGGVWDMVSVTGVSITRGVEGWALPSDGSQPHWGDQLLVYGITGNPRNPSQRRPGLVNFTASGNPLSPPVHLTKCDFLIIFWLYKFQLDHELLKERAIMASCLVATVPDHVSAPDPGRARMNEGMKAHRH